MVQLDEGVTNLELFIGILTDTSAKLQDELDQLDQETAQLESLESQAEDVLGDFNSAADDMAWAVDESGEEAATGIDGTGQAARAIAQDRCAEAEGDAQGAGQAFEDKVRSGGDELQSESGTVVSDGFKNLGETLDRVTQETSQVATSAGQSIDQLTSDAGTAQQSAAGAFDGAENAVATSATEVTGHEATIGAAATAAVATLHGAGSDLEGTCASVQGDNDGTYAAAGDRINDAGDDLGDDAAKALEDTADTLATDAARAVPRAADRVDQSGTAYDGALDAVKTLLDEAVETGTELEPLVADLEKCKGVVDTIDKMLQGM